MPSNNSTSDKDIEPDIVPTIINGIPFKIRPENERIEILKKGRPLPNLAISKKDKNNCCRNFITSWYSIHKWLCASTELNKLFCWPCLLMRPETSSWCSTGINDVIKFQTLASRHEVCKFHVKAISEYDTMLESFGLFPEFLSSNIKCKSEENSTSESDIEDMFDSQVKSDSSKISKENVQYNQEYSGSVKESNSSKVKTSISFKTWQKINKELFPSTRSESVEGKKVLKWKKRIAKQKFKNAKLVEEKLNVEIELLKAKAEFFKLIKTEHMKTVGKSEIEQISDL